MATAVTGNLQLCLIALGLHFLPEGHATPLTESLVCYGRYRFLSDAVRTRINYVQPNSAQAANRTRTVRLFPSGARSIDYAVSRMGQGGGPATHRARPDCYDDSVLARSCFLRPVAWLCDVYKHFTLKHCALRKLKVRVLTI